MAQQPVLTLSMDADDMLKQLRRIAGDQFPFALAKALTNLAQIGQVTAQLKTRTTFNLHSDFIPRGIRIIPARKSDVKSMGIATSAVYTAPRISTFMPGHELGEVRSPFAGGARDKGKFIAVPGRDLRSKSYKTGTGKVRKRWRPSTLLANYTRLEGNKGSTHRDRAPGGRKGTPFIVRDKSNGTAMIVRRRGKKQYPLEVLYILIPRATIKPVWRFEETVQEAVDQVYLPVFDRAISQALITAGAKKS